MNGRLIITRCCLKKLERLVISLNITWTEQEIKAIRDYAEILEYPTMLVGDSTEYAEIIQRFNSTFDNNNKALAEYVAKLFVVYHENLSIAVRCALTSRAIRDALEGCIGKEMTNYFPGLYQDVFGIVVSENGGRSINDGWQTLETILSDVDKYERLLTDKQSMNYFLTACKKIFFTVPDEIKNSIQTVGMDTYIEAINALRDSVASINDSKKTTA